MLLPNTTAFALPALPATGAVAVATAGMAPVPTIGEDGGPVADPAGFAAALERQGLPPAPPANAPRFAPTTAPAVVAALADASVAPTPDAGAKAPIPLDAGPVAAEAKPAIAPPDAAPSQTPVTAATEPFSLPDAAQATSPIVSGTTTPPRIARMAPAPGPAPRSAPITGGGLEAPAPVFDPATADEDPAVPAPVPTQSVPATGSPTPAKSPAAAHGPAAQRLADDAAGPGDATASATPASPETEPTEPTTRHTAATPRRLTRPTDPQTEPPAPAALPAATAGPIPTPLPIAVSPVAAAKPIVAPAVADAGGPRAGRIGHDAPVVADVASPTSLNAPDPVARRTTGPDVAQTAVDPAPVAAASPQQSASHAPQAATAPAAPSAPATQAEPPVVAVHAGRIGHDTGVAIARHVLADGGTEMTVRLDPREFGRVEVTLGFDERGTLRAVVAADNPASLDLLRRDSADLTRALGDAGVRADAATLRFDTRGDGGGGGQQAHRQPPQTARYPAPPADTDDGPDRADAAAWRPLRTRGRIDLMA